MTIQEYGKLLATELLEDKPPKAKSLGDHTMFLMIGTLECFDADTLPEHAKEAKEWLEKEIGDLPFEEVQARIKKEL